MTECIPNQEREPHSVTCQVLEARGW